MLRFKILTGGKYGIAVRAQITGESSLALSPYTVIY